MGTEPDSHRQPSRPWVAGGRVAVRYRVGEVGGRSRYSDVLGQLVGADEAAVRVRREDGEVVVIPRTEVFSVKRIPDRPVRRADPLELDEIAAAGWLAPDSEWLGRWWLRAANGWTRRANSVLPLGDPGQPVQEALSLVRGWYAERGLPVRFQITRPEATQLDDLLAGAGYRIDAGTVVQTASLSTFAGPAAPDLPPVVLDPEPSPGWLAQYREDPTGIARTVLTGSRQPVFASVFDDGELIAIARAVVDFGWLGITALEVAESHRRRGLAGQVMRALATWGAQQGARQCYLQVMAGNEPALALYQRLGFTEHHRYHYRESG